jgi:hypothetical protein
MEYENKYLKYKQKYIDLKNQLSFVQNDSFKQKYIDLKNKLKGGALPPWWDIIISEATKLLLIAQSLEKNHIFFITGSTAIIFYLDLLLKTKHELLPTIVSELNEIISSISKPDDLDLFYGSNGGINLFYDIVQSVPPPPAPTGKFSLSLFVPTFDLDINSCPHFIDIGVFRECIENIESNAAKFEKRIGKDHIFSKIDINRLKYSGKESPYNTVNINGANILALDKLINLYIRTSEENEVTRNKIKILNFINIHIK